MKKINTSLLVIAVASLTMTANASEGFWQRILGSSQNPSVRTPDHSSVMYPGDFWINQGSFTVIAEPTPSSSDTDSEKTP